MLKEHVRKGRARAHAPRRAPAAPPAPAARLGRVESAGEDGTAWVTAPGWLDEPARALVAAPPPGGALELMAGRGVLLLPVEGAEERVAIVGWPADAKGAGPERNLVVDGRRIVITAARELELRCGEARIALTADGKIRIEGKGILNHAREVNRIRGGQVRIN